jgi:hypothetical protein
MENSVNKRDGNKMSGDFCLDWKIKELLKTLMISLIIVSI